MKLIRILIITITLLYSTMDAIAFNCSTMTNSCTAILLKVNCCNQTASGAGRCPAPLPADPSDCTHAGAASANSLWLSCKWDDNTHSCGWAHPR